MRGANPKEAVEDFLRPLRRLISCVTPRIPNARGGYYPSDIHHTVVIGDGQPIPLARLGRLKLRFAHHYRILRASGERRQWEVRTTGYFYSLDDSDDQEIIAYHWHPERSSPIRFPHLHLGAGADCRREELITAHCPTGLISVSDFLRLAIMDFGVEPLRADWRQVFSETQRDFEL